MISLFKIFHLIIMSRNASFDRKLKKNPASNNYKHHCSWTPATLHLHLSGFLSFLNTIITNCWCWSNWLYLKNNMRRSRVNRRTLLWSFTTVYSLHDVWTREIKHHVYGERQTSDWLLSFALKTTGSPSCGFVENIVKIFSPVNTVIKDLKLW